MITSWALQILLILFIFEILILYIRIMRNKVKHKRVYKITISLIITLLVVQAIILDFGPKRKSCVNIKNIRIEEVKNNLYSINVSIENSNEKYEFSKMRDCVKLVSVNNKQDEQIVIERTEVLSIFGWVESSVDTRNIIIYKYID